MVLATIQVPMSGGGSPTVIWVAPYTVAAGAPTPVWSATDRDAKFPAPYDGLQVYRLDTHKTETYSGTSWGNGSAVAVTAAPGTSGPITTAWVAVATAPAVTGDGVKKFLITFTYTEAYSTVAGDLCQFAIRNGAATVGPYQDVSLTAIWANGRTLSVFDTPAAGAVTYAASAYRKAGTGTVTVGSSQVIVQQIA
jgi:hypothetical protein